MSPRRSSRLHVRMSCSFALTLMFLPQAVQAVTPSSASLPLAVSHASSKAPSKATDVALSAGGTLTGQIIDASGTPIAGAAMQLTSGKDTWNLRSAADGSFHLAGLRGGGYLLVAAGQSQRFRAWAPGTAPPQANQGLLILPTLDVVRGQRVLSPNTNQFVRVAKHQLTNPWIIGGTIAAVVAVPVAIHNADDSDPAPATP